MERNPHLLFEGCLIGCWAIGAKVAYIYIRGEFYHVQRVMEAELEKAYAQGYAGKNIMGTRLRLRHRHPPRRRRLRGGRRDRADRVARRQARAAAHQAAVPGRRRPLQTARPRSTTSRRSATCRRSSINGADWFAKLGPEKNGGPKLYCVSGHVKKPGVFEASMNMTLKELIFDRAGGIRDGHQLKAVIPGGSSVPILLPDQLDIPASFDAVQKAGSMLGSAGIIVMDETTCMVWAAMNLMHFYKHESCGKCTPCREGGDWLFKILSKIERGDGEMRDLDLLTSVSNNIAGKTLCAFGDAEATPPLTTLKHFRAEYEAHIREGRCTVPADWRARGAVGGGALDERTDPRRFRINPSRSSHAGADLRRLPRAGARVGVHGVDGAQGLRLHPGPRGPEPGRPGRPAAAVRRRHQAGVQGGPAAEGGRRASSS